jgi:hypothetical protein
MPRRAVVPSDTHDHAPYGFWPNLWNLIQGFKPWRGIPSFLRKGMHLSRSCKHRAFRIRAILGKFLIPRGRACVARKYKTVSSAKREGSVHGEYRGGMLA